MGIDVGPVPMPFPATEQPPYDGQAATADSAQLAAWRRLPRLSMAGTCYEIVVLSSSPPAAELYDAPSPPKGFSPATRRVAMSPPSPLAFSPPASPERTAAGASKTNPRAAPIPEGVVRGFATVGSLVRSEHFADQPDDDLTKTQQPQSRRRSLEGAEEKSRVSNKPRKRAAKKSTADDTTEAKPKPRARKPKADKPNTALDPDLRLPASTKSPFFPIEDAVPPIDAPKETADPAPKLTKSGKPRKPRAKKQPPEHGKAETESKPKRTRTTKPKGAAGAGKLQREGASVVSSHFRGNGDRGEEAAADELGPRKSADLQNAADESISLWEIPPSPRPANKAPVKQRPPDPIAEGLQLEEAVARRRDWTPPPQDTAVTTPFTDSVGKENKQSAQDANGTFTHMLSNFAYARSPSAQITLKTVSSTTDATAATKRRRVELIEVPSNQSNSRNSSPEKGKAPKKKPRTITDLVTGQYAPKDPSPDPHAVMSNFFQPPTTTTKVPLNDVSAPEADASLKKPPLRRSKSKSNSEDTGPKAKSKKTSGKVAKPKPVAEKLLSPTSAVLRMNRQDVLFGTSSQLALEESPGMVRQLQLALKESELDIATSPELHLPAPPRWPRLLKVEGKRKLWAAGARDDDGSMLEHMEDVYIPEPDRTQDISLLMDGTHDESDSVPAFGHIDDLDPPPLIAISSDLPTPPRTTSQASQHIKPDDVASPFRELVFEDIDDFEQEPPPSNQNVDSQNSFADIEDFHFPPSAQLLKSAQPTLRPPISEHADEIPMQRPGTLPKPRATIPAVAESSTMKLNPGPSQPNRKPKMPHIPLTPPKSSSRFIDIEEILDSEDEALEALSPTPPRTRNIQDCEPLPLVSLDSSPTKATSKPTSDTSALTPVFRIPTSSLQWEHIKADIFSRITLHIRTLPPTTDPKRPCWHEKILMYDPIVLEDLTAHLNSTTTIRTYKKATQKQIKAWNQKLKSDAQAVLSVGENGEEVLAIEKALETYMVQGWCESMSVCCIYGEGRGHGGARKGLY
ncbi:5'-flap endonuclease [Neocucurbitaria cava]|uniref:Structure-specific endonuclease subunit SLX4 n=1 Tax=Neocucurbitaria cava TaxID=798079 RepID=A0A9W8XZQ5_9PLEO|nr:5'-flap endonuclease [Neocucurbitaria cava]